MNPLILQVTDVKSPYDLLIEEFKPRHELYAARHGFDYIWLHAPDPAWAKVERVAEELERRELVVYLDADAAIVDMDADLRDALEGCDRVLGAAWHKCPAVYDHWNAGVLYVKNCLMMVRYWSEYRGGALAQHHWAEQHCLNKGVLCDPDRAHIHQLKLKWHATINLDYDPAQKPVVVAAHGCGDWLTRLKLLKDVVNKWNANNKQEGART